jgi:uncharacterized phiE125 gp8 family phage protein
MSGNLSEVTAPTVLPLSLNECKAHLRVPDTENDEDALIMSYLRSTIEEVDGRDGWLGRALCTQTWKYKLDYFPRSTRFRRHSSIVVPLPPLQSVTHVKYIDTAGDLQTWASTNYTVTGTEPNNYAPGLITPVWGEVWPSTRDVPEAVEVQFVCGYTNTNSNTQNAIPDSIRNALLIMLAHRYEQRQETVVGTIVASMPNSAKDLLYRYQVHEWR